MNTHRPMRRRVIAAFLSCCLATSFPASRAAPATPTRQAIVGAWRLVSIDYAGPNGALADPVFGPDPRGILIYDQSGWMSVQIVTADRPAMRKPATRTSGVVTADATKLAARAFDTYYAYFGTWEYNADTSVVTHHLTSSLLPYETGLDYAREVTFDGVHLTLTARLQDNGAPRRRTLRWTRASAAAPVAEPPDTVSSAPQPLPTQQTPAAPPRLPPPPPPPPPSPESQPPTASLAESGPPKPVPVATTKYGDMPVDYTGAVRRYFLQHLKYPDTVQYQEITKPEQGYVTAITGTLLMRETREYGWTVKATINAKNAGNGFVGLKTYIFLFRGEKIVDTRLPLPGDEMIDTAVTH